MAHGGRNRCIAAAALALAVAILRSAHWMPNLTSELQRPSTWGSFTAFEVCLPIFHRPHLFSGGAHRINTKVVLILLGR